MFKILQNGNLLMFEEKIMTFKFIPGYNSILTNNDSTFERIEILRRQVKVTAASHHVERQF